MVLTDYPILISQMKQLFQIQLDIRGNGSFVKERILNLQRNLQFRSFCQMKVSNRLDLLRESMFQMCLHRGFINHGLQQDTIARTKQVKNLLN